MADGGLKAFLKEAVPWVIVSWCLVHHLELSLKDALKFFLHQLMSWSISYTKI